MQHSVVRYLMDQYIQGRITDSEREDLLRLTEVGNGPVLIEILKEMLTDDSLNQPVADAEQIRLSLLQVLSTDKMSQRDMDQSDGSATYETFSEPSPQQIPPVHRIHFLKTTWFRYAAVIILVLGIGAYLWNANKENIQRNAEAAKMTDIAPGTEGAILTLADGRQVVLDSLGNGVVATQNGTAVVLKDGLLVYDPGGRTSGVMVYNKMSTPKGRQFKVLLPDGTRVWLNAASSIKYPTVFVGKERKVEITGEAYFEVVKNTEMPFRVNVNNQAEIEVLGTHFNVNAYNNEASINTTLLEGSVRVKKGSERVVLKPGQQAQIFQAQVSIHSADIDKVMAWKNGLFNFEGMRLREVMQQLERWYDIEVVYEEGVQDMGFYGQLNRSISLRGVIKALEHAGVHFRIEGRKLIVLP